MIPKSKGARKFGAKTRMKVEIFLNTQLDRWTLVRTQAETLGVFQIVSCSARKVAEISF